MVIGYTSLEPHEVQDVVQQLGYEFRGNSYHLLERNCARLACSRARRLPSALSLLTGHPAAHAVKGGQHVYWLCACVLVCRLMLGAVWQAITSQTRCVRS